MDSAGLAGLEWLCERRADAAKYYSGAIRAMKELEEANCKLGLNECKGAYRWPISIFAVSYLFIFAFSCYSLRYLPSLHT